MDARRKQELKELMVTAWNLARFGANRFGGPTSMYFWMALRIAWRERGGKSVYYTKGNVAQMWMGIVPRQEKVKRGQIMLPGPVSYTHLDVYKRQAEWTPNFRIS